MILIFKKHNGHAAPFILKASDRDTVMMATLRCFIYSNERIAVLTYIAIVGTCIWLRLSTQLPQNRTQYASPQFSPTTVKGSKLLVTTLTTMKNQSVSILPPSQTLARRVIHKYLKKQRDLCEREWIKKSFLINATSMLPLICDCVPETLLGASLDINLNPVPLEETAANNINVKLGGHWEPSNCTARYRVVIVIPFRDRHSHLSTLLHYLHPLLQGQQVNYTIVVVEQNLPKIFNKAVMMNIGYQYAVMNHNPDCIIFHDVDFIPEDGRHLYRCRDKPVHFGAFNNRHKYKLFYPRFFGGVTVFIPAQFKRVNGFSNLYFGWGGEDDDMEYRIRDSKQGIIRDPREVAGYRTIEHKRDKGNIQPNQKATLKRLHYERDVAHDGLNTLRYVLRDVKLYPLYTWLLADIGPVRL